MGHMVQHHSPLTNARALPRAAWFLYAGAFLNRFGSFVIPFLVLFLTRQGYTAAQAALAISAYGAGHVCASLLGGHLADNMGRRKTIAYSMIASAAAMLALSQAHSYILIVAITAFAGAAAEMYRPAAAALLGDLVPHERRVTAFAMLRLANNLGFVVGPATGGFLASKSFLILFIGDAATSVCFAIIAFAALPHGIAARETDRPARGAYRAALADVPFMIFVVASLCITWIEYQIVTTLPLHVRTLGYPPSTFGLLISVNGMLVTAFELVLTGWTQRFAPRPVIALGFVLFAGGFAVVGAAGSVPMLLAAVVLWTFGEMIFAPVAGAYLTELAPERLRGAYNGIWWSTWSIGALFGPYVGATLFLSAPDLYWIVVAGAGVAGALLMLVSGRVGRRGDDQATSLTVSHYPSVQTPSPRGQQSEPGRTQSLSAA